MMKSLLTAASAALLCCPAFCAEQAHQPSGVVDPYAGNIVRLSKIKVDPAQLDAYKAFAAEVGRESMKLEPGVRVLYSMQEQRDPTQFYILEIYASQQAYQSHIQSQHFQKYKKGTIKMVQELNLIDCSPLVPEALIKPVSAP